MKEYNPIVILRTIFTLGFIMMVPFCWSQFIAIQWHTFTYTAYFALGSVIVAGTFLAYLFNIYGIKILGASVSGSYIYLQPLFAAVIAIAFRGEHLGLYKIIAAILIFTGVYFVNKQAIND
jgi:drug/metabolite transporter (DMT)-like permease